MRCDLCGAADASVLIDRARVPVFQNIAYRDEHAARRCPTGRLSVALCRRCGFAANVAFDPSLVRYAPDYVNDQSVSSRFARHLAQRAAAVLDRLPARDAAVAEVGCGQGGFLALLAGSGRVARAHGFDPAARAVVPVPGVAIHAAALDPARIGALGPLDAIIARHVVEHVPHPVAFLRQLADAATPRRTRVFIETPCLEWILGHYAVYDFFYEHCTYFTRATLHAALAQAGLSVIRIDRVFDGQYLWAEATPGPAPASRPPDVDAAVLNAADRFVARRDGILARLVRLGRGQPPAALWGAGGKGVTLAGLLDPERSSIDCLIDINPDKQGFHVAATGHPVVSPQAAAARGVRAVVVMNPSYRDEIADHVASHALPFRVLAVDGVP